MSSTEISKNFKQVNPGPLSEWYGPYPDLLSACNAIPNIEGLYEGVMVNFRKDKVVGITTPEGTVDYWWPKVFTNAGLVRKEVSKLEFDTYVASQNERNIVFSGADTYLQQQVTTHGTRISAVEELAATATTPAEVNTSIQAAVAALMNGAPGALDTLKELADAMGNNQNFAATVTNALAVLSGADTYLQQQVSDGVAFATYLNNRVEQYHSEDAVIHEQTYTKNIQQDQRLTAVELLADTAATPAEMNIAIQAAVAALMNGAPGALDTLKELADAMGSDPNFAATVTNSLATIDGRLDDQDARNIILSGADTYLQQQVSTNHNRIEDVNFKYNQIYIEHATKIFAVEQIAAEATTPAEVSTAIQAAIASLMNGAPGALDTLKELADAMGNDPNFAATVTNALATLQVVDQDLYVRVNGINVRMNAQDERNIILSNADTDLQQQISDSVAYATYLNSRVEQYHVEDAVIHEQTYTKNIQQDQRLTSVELLAETATTPAEMDAAIQAAITALMNGAPGALDTLKELAAAMGNDPNFAATVTNAMATLGSRIGNFEDLIPGFVTKVESLFAGRFLSLSAANLAIPNAVLGGKNARDGKQVLIGSANNYIAYWWKGGYADANLVEYVNGKAVYPVLYVDENMNLIAGSVETSDATFSLNNNNELILTT